jgi:hypothetical protein
MNPQEAMQTINRFHIGLILAAAILLPAESVRSADCCDDSEQQVQSTQHSPHRLKPNEVAFYNVPLVCPAAPQIGCGSASKPVLVGLESRLPGAQAWLNRSGTVMAVVWSEKLPVNSQAKALKAMLNDRGITATALKGKARNQALFDFQSGTDWYRSTEVDRLSEEEAGVIAAKWVGRIRDKITLADPKASLLQEGFTDALKRKLTGQITRAEARDEMLKVCREHLNEGDVNVLLAAFKTELTDPPGQN